jgi:hypothetical protein
MTLLTPLDCQDQVYPAYLDRLQLASIASPGVVNPATDYIVTPSSGLQVQMSAGKAYVQQSVNTEGGSFYNGLYYCVNDGVISPSNTIVAPVSNPRIDQVALIVTDVAEQSIGGASSATVKWVTGTEAAGASLTNLDGIGTLPPNSLLLAFVLQEVAEVAISSGNILQAAPQAISPLQSTRLVTALPLSPQDGQTVDLLADATNGVVWRFRYRAASSSTYKWEFVGGAALYSEVQTSQNTLSGATYGDLTTAGPSVTLPTLPNGGDFDVTVGANIEVGYAITSGNDVGYMSYAIGGTAASDSNAAFVGAVVTTSNAGANTVSASRTRRQTAVSGGTALVAKYRNTDASEAATFADRYLLVRPVRVG